MQTLGHTCTGTCVCNMKDREGEATFVRNPECPGKRIIRGETHGQGSEKGKLVKSWDVKTGAEVSELVRVVRGSASVPRVIVFEVF